MKRTTVFCRLSLSFVPLLLAACGGADGIGEEPVLEQEGDVASLDEEFDEPQIERGRTPQGDMGSDEEIYAALEGLGFARDSIEFDGNIIRAEDDIILYRDAVMAGEYGSLDELMSEEGLTEKGYRRSSIVTQSRVKNLRLIWGSGSEYPDSNMRNLFNLAALWDWSGNNWPTYHDTKISISTNNTGTSIRVRSIDAVRWTSLSPCSSSALACADYPRDGRPGRNIWIRDDLNPFDNAGQCDWTNSTILRVANHELGHTLGVTHPKESGSSRVSGTSSCPFSRSTCVNNAGYATVMTNVAFDANCNTTPSSLTADDLDVASTMYPN